MEAGGNEGELNNGDLSYVHLESGDLEKGKLLDKVSLYP